MYGKFKNKLFGQKKLGHGEIDPDQIFMDSSNIPNFDQNHLEGNIERAINKKTSYATIFFAGFIIALFIFRLWNLQIDDFKTYAERSENNRLRNAIVFAERGKIFDRNDVLLASNVFIDSEAGLKGRKYEPAGLGNTIGFVKYPQKDKSGFYYQTEIIGLDGIEKTLNNVLAGQNGMKIIEVDALNNIKSESVYQNPQNGSDIRLSVDSRLSSALYEIISNTASDRKFAGGAAIVMDITNGEIVALISFPGYDSQILTDGTNSEALKNYASDQRTPYLYRVTNGLYTPGSIVKPFVALGVLNEKLIDPEKEILSTGSISIPNEYDPEKKSVFNDWKAHGLVDMRKALAVSSNVYFYEVGGGFEKQAGLGIAGLEKYLRLFGFGKPADNDFLKGEEGTIPNQEWKELNFPNDPWRIGDTYNTAIGQYGLQVTPLQVVRAMSAIANDGILIEPTILKEYGTEPITKIQTGIPAEYFKIVKEGLRQAVTEGTASGLNIPNVKIAAKTGTAEIGTVKKYVNSWVTGFFPYDKPRYAFAAVMEKGPQENTIGALYVMRQFIEWLAVYTPEYTQ